MHDSELILNADGSVYHLGLHPEDLAPTVICVGDPDRVERVTRYFDAVQLKKEKREFVTHTGSLQGKRVTVISTGISTDNIDIVLNELDALANIDLQLKQPKDKLQSLRIIRLGTSGSIHPDIDIDTIIVSANAVGMDGLDRHYAIHESSWKPSGWNDVAMYLNDIVDVPLYVRSADASLLRTFRQFRKGTTLTCPGFYGPQGRSLRIASRLDPFLGELHFQKLDGVPFTNMEMESAGIYLLAHALGHRAISVNAILANRLDGEFSTDPGKTVDRMIRESLELIVSIDN